MRLYSLLLLIFTLSCSPKQDLPKQTKGKDTLVQHPVIEEATEAQTEILETFTDSLLIGQKGKSKIELIKHRVLDDYYVIIKFYTKGANNWLIQNTYSYESNSIREFEPVISDYNNDGLNDITFISATAARGGNEVRRLFVYHQPKDELISIVNSQDFPNMLYNKELDCIDAFMIHGGTTSVFARIKKDSLIEFAGVDNGTYRTVYEINAYGKRKVLSSDSITDFDEVFVRHKNYKPLKAYTN